MDAHSFLNFDFTPVGLDHHAALEEFLRRYPQPLSGYTMATLSAWQASYRYGWAFASPETLLISWDQSPGSPRHLLQPVGPVPADVRDAILAGAAALPYPLEIVNASSRFLKENPELLEHCTAREERSMSNYLYRADALARLPGRKYSKKRNLLSQATKLYAWESEPLTAEGTGACREVLEAIEKEESPVMEGMLEREIAALGYTLDHFRELGQQGLLIRVEGAPVAFSIYEAIGPKAVAVHFERALRRYKGLYQVINRETAQAVAAQGYDCINREEDMGDPGLRDAKRSYHPIRIVPAFILTYRGRISA